MVSVFTNAAEGRESLLERMSSLLTNRLEAHILCLKTVTSVQLGQNTYQFFQLGLVRQDFFFKSLKVAGLLDLIKEVAYAMERLNVDSTGQIVEIDDVNALPDDIVEGVSVIFDSRTPLKELKNGLSVNHVRVSNEEVFGLFLAAKEPEILYFCIDNNST